MKPVLKAPGIKCYPPYDDLLSNFAFKFILRCYTASDRGVAAVESGGGR